MGPSPGERRAGVPDLGCWVDLPPLHKAQESRHLGTAGVDSGVVCGSWGVAGLQWRDTVATAGATGPGVCGTLLCGKGQAAVLLGVGQTPVVAGNLTCTYLSETWV